MVMFTLFIRLPVSYRSELYYITRATAAGIPQIVAMYTDC